VERGESRQLRHPFQRRRVRHRQRAQLRQGGADEGQLAGGEDKRPVVVDFYRQRRQAGERRRRAAQLGQAGAARQAANAQPFEGRQRAEPLVEAPDALRRLRGYWWG
jgi:hypothetical protein